MIYNQKGSMILGITYIPHTQDIHNIGDLTRCQLDRIHPHELQLILSYAVDGHGSLLGDIVATILNYQGNQYAQPEWCLGKLKPETLNGPLVTSVLTAVEAKRLKVERSVSSCCLEGLGFRV